MQDYPLLNQDLNMLGIKSIIVRAEKSSEVNNTVYLSSVFASIVRILTTRQGERVMRPTFGSNLYLLRDRTFNAEWRIKATRYIYESIKQLEPRVTFKRLIFTIDALTGKHNFKLELDLA